MWSLPRSRTFSPRSTCTVFTDFPSGTLWLCGQPNRLDAGTLLRRYASSPGDRWGANFESVPVGFSLRVTRCSLLFAHARHLHRVRAGRVARNASVQRLRDLLAVAVVAQLLFIRGTADEGNFRQDRWHRGFVQHHKPCFLYATVANAWILTCQRCVH